MSLALLARRSLTGSAALGHNGFLGKSAAVVRTVLQLGLCLAENHIGSFRCHNHPAVLDPDPGRGFGFDTDHTCFLASCLYLQGFLDHQVAGQSLLKCCSLGHRQVSRRSYLPSLEVDQLLYITYKNQSRAEKGCWKFCQLEVQVSQS